MTKKEQRTEPQGVKGDGLAYRLVKALLDDSAPTDMHNRLAAWFGSAVNEEEKRNALRRFMYENLEPAADMDNEATLRQFYKLADRLGLEISRNKEQKTVLNRLKPVRIRLLRRIAAAVIPLLVAGGAYLAVRSAFADRDIVVLAEVAVDDIPGATREIALSDNTRVSVGAGGKFAYPEIFTGERLVHLEGEATFRVAEDSRNPFRVKTNTVTVTVLGTEFTVTEPAGSTSTQVALYKGSVEVTSPIGSHTLRPGQLYDYEHGSSEVSITEIAGAYMDLLGYTPSLTLDNVPLSEILFSVEKNFGVRFDVAADIDTDGNYSVAYGGETLDNILYTLSITANLTFRQGSDTILVTK